MSFSKDKTNDIFKSLTTFLWQKSKGDFYTETNYSFPSTLDGDPVVRTFDNFTIGPTAVVTTQNRCKGLYLNILRWLYYWTVHYQCHLGDVLEKEQI